MATNATLRGLLGDLMAWFGPDLEAADPGLYRRVVDALSEIAPSDPGDEGAGQCGTCGGPLQFVRPGKVQCPRCE